MSHLMQLLALKQSKGLTSLLHNSAAEVWTEGRKSVAGSVFTRKHVTIGVSFEVELRLIMAGAHTQAGASVSCVITQGQG